MTTETTDQPVRLIEHLEQVLEIAAPGNVAPFPISVSKEHDPPYRKKDPQPTWLVTIEVQRPGHHDISIDCRSTSLEKALDQAILEVAKLEYHETQASQADRLFGIAPRGLAGATA